MRRTAEDLLQALLEDFAAEGDNAAEASTHDPDFSAPAAVDFHIEEFWHFSRRPWPVPRAVAAAALVNEDFARMASRFGMAQLEEVADHLDGFDAARLRPPGTAEVSVAMMFLLVRAMIEAIEDGVLDLTDEQAIEALIRFVYRGLTGRDC